MQNVTIECPNCGATAATINITPPVQGSEHHDVVLVRRWVESKGSWPAEVSYLPSHLYDAYVKWAREHGADRLSQRRMSQALLASDWTFRKTGEGRRYVPAAYLPRKH